MKMALARTFVRSTAKRALVRLYSTSAEPVTDGKNVDLETHTGQVWDKEDYRRVRFVDTAKQINPYFAIDLIEEDPVVVVNDRFVWSDSGGALGHPKVYINLDKPQVGVCGYSGRKFIQKKFYDEKLHGPSITYEQYLEEVRPKPRN